MLRSLLLAFLLLLSALPAGAVQPDEMLKDPVLEARARELSEELRCMVCQNQSIDDSDATLAKDLRFLVRERLTAGDSNDAVKAFLVARYGDFILLRPPFEWRTLLPWTAPFLLLIIGGAFALLGARRRRRSAVVPKPLDEVEKKRLDEILKQE